MAILPRSLVSPILCSAALLVFAPFSPAATAGEVEIGAGIAKDIDGEATGVATLAWLTEQRHPWEFMVGFIDERHQNGVVSVDDTFWIAVSKRLTWRGLYGSFGVALAEEDNEVLSDHLQFQSAIGYRWGDASVSLRHLSNGSISGRNRGETFLLLHYAF
jgi:hypothetical protein